MTGRRLDLALNLLDRQVLDAEGRAVGNVDDVELLVPEDGSAPYVVALLTGPQALGPRLGGLLGQWVVFVTRSLTTGDTSHPGRIGMELLIDLGSKLTVARSREELGVHRNEDRARHYFVDRIPGSRHEG